MIYCTECEKKLKGLVATPYFCYHRGFKFLTSGFGKSPFQIYKEKRVAKIQALQIKNKKG